MAFSDLFQGDNLNQLLSSPGMLLGLQMLQQGGYQPGNPSFGQRLGAAGLGAAQQLQQAQHSQALQQYRSAMMQQQQQQLALQQQAAQAKADQQQRQAQALQDPQLQAALGPLARLMAGAGFGMDDVLRAQSGDNLQAHRQATLAQQASQFDQRLSHQGGGQSSGPRMPAPRPYIDQPIGNNQMQRFKYDPEKQDYTPWGEPFSQYSPGRKATGAQAAADAILGAEQSADEPDVSSLPGNTPLSSYMPQPQQPLVVPMAAQGGGLAQTQQPGTRKPGQPKIATPMTREEYDALPPGTAYIDPVSGKTATKRG
ncbi:hypothetical protein FGL97_09035 [Pseudomonas putida]|uniref:hypothetical protein n=1 Tax=Pseudomonas putida TaxID=303 RepID=UPI00159DFBCB|nr:hypothetical protein [Pseudomonas putida]NVN63367.1 hypothetical protein [Pseudomonas putida]NVN68360.1 hypothetical protein [Pseudomonas putida]